MPLSRLFALFFLGCTGLGHAEQTNLTHTPAAVDLPGKVKPAPVPQSGIAAPVPEAKLTAQFDKDGDHRLNAAERQAAREFLKDHPLPEPVPLTARPGEAPPQPLALEPVTAGEKYHPAAAPDYSSRPLFDPAVVRTLFLDFEDIDWEDELSDFARTDILVPARVTLDGRVYPDVGVHLRARPAEQSLTTGYKRSLELVLDHAHHDQRIAGRSRLELQAPTTDSTYLRPSLYARVAAEYLPAPKTGYVRVVINGEYWGVYLNVEPLDDQFVRDNFHAAGVAFWTALPGGNLAYLGDDPEPYRKFYRLRSADDPSAWHALVQLCRAIAQAKPGEFEAELEPRLDIDGALKFFALENALINQDGYGSRNGSYGLVLDPAGRFHLVPRDAESSFRLVQASEYERTSPRGPRSRGDQEADRTAGATKPKETHGYSKDNYPHQTQTNLAMLLSYSFVNKADSDFDEKITKEEWLSFAQSWFIVMDEDSTGRLTRGQFVDKVRLLITPPSVIDGRSRQTFGKEDPAALIGRDLFNAMDADHDDRLTRDEMVGAFDHWFAEWSDPVSRRLDQQLLQRAFSKLFSQSVFTADQTYVASRETAVSGEERGDRGEGGGRGRGRGGEGGGYGGSGLNVGPLHLGGLGRKASDAKSLVTFSEELDALAGADDATKPLLSRILAAPDLRGRYLNYVRDIAENWLSWEKLGPIAREYHDLIADDVRKDTHKATSYEKFVQEFDQNTNGGSREGDAAPSLKDFVDERGNYLRKDDLVNGSGN